MKNGTEDTNGGNHQQKHTASDDSAHYRNVRDVRGGLRKRSDRDKNARDHLQNTYWSQNSELKTGMDRSGSFPAEGFAKRVGLKPAMKGWVSAGQCMGCRRSFKVGGQKWGSGAMPQWVQR